MKAKLKYEVKICHFSNVDIEEDNAIVKMQDEGWEIAGQIGVPQNPTWCGDKSITVPFKRTINKQVTMKILTHLKRILKTLREQLALALHECSGMCKHCPEKYARICRCNSERRHP